MSRRWGATEMQVQTWIAAFDGRARGADYRPFTRVRQISSKGRGALVKGIKTGRIHEYLKDLEYYYHILAEYSPEVVDILERYALLPREETISIAEELGIRHPVYPGSNTPKVLTTNMVLVVAGPSCEEFRPVCLEYSSQLNPKQKGEKGYAHYSRTNERLLISQQYWRHRGETERLCTEKMLLTKRAHNLDALRATVIAKECDWLNPLLPEFVLRFQEFWSARARLNDILVKTAAHFRILPSEAMVLFGRAVWLRLLPVNLDSEAIHHEFPISLDSDENSPNQHALPRQTWPH